MKYQPLSKDEAREYMNRWVEDAHVNIIEEVKRCLSVEIDRNPIYPGSEMNVDFVVRIPRLYFFHFPTDEEKSYPEFNEWNW